MTEQIKSKERVQKYGEVFTPQWEIKEVAKELARIVYAKGWGWLIDDVIQL